jgi:outer membrane protein TolC
LKDCLRIAMERNHSRPASRFAVAIAEAQHRQALAGYWPQLTARAGVEQMQHAPDFVFPASQMSLPSQSITTPAGTASVTIPANTFAPGFPPVAVTMPVSFPGQTISTPAQLLTVPAQNVKLMEPRTESIRGEIKWLLWDGGMRRGYVDQAKAGEEAAQAEVRRTDLELSENVSRIYWGAVLARQLHQLGSDTLERMETTLRVTESLYKEGSGAVNKADYLDNKVMVETIRSLVATLAENEAAAEAALAYTMGLAWDASVTPADTEIPYHPTRARLSDLVAEAYEFNPDWKQLEAGLKAYEAERKTAASGFAPKIALTGSLHRYWNSYGTALAVSPNMQGWTIGAGVEIPIFDGFLTSGKVAEAQARINKLKEQKLVLKEGLGLQLRQLFLQLDASEKIYASTRDAMLTAQEDDELTTRGYSAGLLTTEKVVRAQIQEALVSAAYYRAVYEHQSIQSQIDLTVGKQVQLQIAADHSSN